MLDPAPDRRSPASPQLAMRVAVLGAVAFAIFAVVFFRLWFLQVLSGDRYVAEAAGNRVREVMVQAPRGEILDRAGVRLVRNRTAVAIAVAPRELPEDPAARRDVYGRLSRVLGRSPRLRDCPFGSGARVVVKQRMALQCTVEQHAAVLPYADVVVHPDASRAVYTYLAERAIEFPGVEVQQAYTRAYPLGEVGAHLFGTVGQLSEEDLEQERFRGVPGGSIVGKDGLERAYDHHLRGRNGAERIQVNASGERTRDLLPIRPVPGNDLVLSVDAGLQRAGQQALTAARGLAQQNGNPARGGAFVAIDPQDGAVLALGSDPTFDPNLFTRPIPQRVYDRLTSEEHGVPILNRAIAGEFAVGSTFKVVTAIAALAAGKVTVEETYNDTGLWKSGTQERRNAGGASFGPVSLIRALAVSVDTYFYVLGERLNADPVRHPRGGALQQWARRFGFGAPTGIDLGGEQDGVVPDSTSSEPLKQAERECRRRERKASCGKANLDDVWTVGDNVSLAIGQGDFLATPLQVAVAYAAIANGGTIVRPHVGMKVLDPDGRVVERIAPRPARRLQIPELDAIRAGLLAATTDPRGTSAGVFAGFPKPVHGKTGTVQYHGRPDQSWYAAYVDDPERPIVVVAMIEDGGYGAEAAAPAVRLILSQWFGVRGELVAGAKSD